MYNILGLLTLKNNDFFEKSHEAKFLDVLQVI